MRDRFFEFTVNGDPDVRVVRKRTGSPDLYYRWNGSEWEDDAYIVLGAFAKEKAGFSVETLPVEEMP